MGGVLILLVFWMIAAIGIFIIVTRMAKTGRRRAAGAAMLAGIAGFAPLVFVEGPAVWPWFEAQIVGAALLGLPALFFQQRFTLLALFGALIACWVVGDTLVSELVEMLAPLFLAFSAVFAVGAIDGARNERA